MLVAPYGFGRRGALSLSALVNSTGLLVSKAYQLLGDFHRQSLSVYYLFFQPAFWQHFCIRTHR